ncbi:formate dehydrogenase subunit delta [Dokdonella koreensis]|uniref:Formate dehydrogenase subunit delta n=1 Tax=Dokdonella koreensis DS-123 TaxID=1300342 RepID=A0A167G875_9GAMM|nr:formate dehydrogenase subunit delta [Dokdonella koreensis]ANB16251.1 Formate dehydrogenase subunit delta [Dokdonella koreensis DS-123]
MDVERLVQMANDIANYFASEPDREAGIEGMAGHIRRFWEPRMRRQILAHWQAGGEGLLPLAGEAIARLAAAETARSA